MTIVCIVFLPWCDYCIGPGYGRVSGFQHFQETGARPFVLGRMILPVNKKKALVSHGHIHGLL